MVALPKVTPIALPQYLPEGGLACARATARVKARSFGMSRCSGGANLSKRCVLLLHADHLRGPCCAVGVGDQNQQ